MTKVDNPTISFTEDDAWRLHHPHDDALVINLSIANFNTQTVDILYYLAYQQMRIDSCPQIHR